MSVIYRFIFDYEIYFGYWLFFIPIFLLSFIVAIFVVLVNFCIKKSYDGWKFWLKYLLMLIVGMEFTAYIQEAYVRTNNLYKDCKKELSPDRNYVGEVCILDYINDSTEDHLWLKVYDAETLKLIKEGDGGTAIYNINWRINELGQIVSMYSDTKDWKEALTLPPSWLDKLRAKLP
jgi:hypothetical protein